MAKNSLYGGFVGGKARAITFGPQDPSMDNQSLIAQEWMKRLQAHYSVGIKNLPPISGKRRPNTSGVTGSKVSGATRITGGTV
jgi:hypothetical protein